MPTTPWRRRSALLIRTGAVAYLLILLAMTCIERWMVYPIPPVSRSDWNPEGISFEEAAFLSEDGVRLHGWFFEHPSPRRAVLYCHGNGEQVADNALLMDYVRRKLQASVLIFDYRGYGHSEGKPFEKGIVADGLAAADWLSERTGKPPDRLVLIGRSIGGAVGVAIAAEQGAGALVLQSTFTRLTDAAAHHFPWLPVHFLMQNQYDSLARIDQYEGPLFASHGTLDRVVPFQQGRKLFDAAPGGPKEFFEIENGDHNDPQSGVYWKKLTAFLEKVDP